MNKKMAIPFLICFIGLLFGACSKKDSAVKAVDNNATDSKAVDNKTVGNKNIGGAFSSTFQNVCHSVRNNFQPCVDIQDKNEEKLAKKVNNCTTNAMEAFDKVHGALTAKQKEALGLEYENALLMFAGCFIVTIHSSLGTEEKKMCINRFMDEINSNFCSF